MIVYLKPAVGTVEDNLNRAKSEMGRTIGFRGTVTGAEAASNRIAVTIKINPKWDLPSEQKALNLEEWIRAKTRTLFRVMSIE